MKKRWRLGGAQKHQSMSIAASQVPQNWPAPCREAAGADSAAALVRAGMPALPRERLRAAARETHSWPQLGETTQNPAAPANRAAAAAAAAAAASINLESRFASHARAPQQQHNKRN